MTRAQLLELGFGREAINHRIAKRRLHPAYEGVYAVGRPQLTRYGRWMAAVLACGDGAVLSHADAGALYGIRPHTSDEAIHVSVPSGTSRRRPGIIVHRRKHLDVTTHQGIPVTPPIATLIDIAPDLTPNQREAAINEADKRDLVDPETLRAALDEAVPRPGTATLRETLDRRTFTLTDSQLERRFLPLARKAGLPPPQTQQRVNGHRVDFYWPYLKLVVETDGLRYHRTPAQQARDRVRDQTHAAAGLTTLRFTHAQVAHEPAHVEATLTAVAHHVER